MQNKKTRLLYLALILAGITAATTYLITEHQYFPYPYVKAVEKKLLQTLRPPPPSEPTIPAEREVESIFLRLKLNTVLADMPASKVGGGLTSFGDELLLINQLGEIFLVRDDAIEPTAISTPDNGLKDYIAAADNAEFAQFNINPKVIRYNDILYYRNEGEHGLVISYTEWRSEQRCYDTAIARLKLAQDATSILGMQADPEDWDIVYRTQPCLPLKNVITAIEGHMAGGRIAFKPPSTVFLGSGDYHWDGVYAPKIFAQSADNDYGKVLAISLDSSTAKRLTLGNRNMQGILLDKSEQLWITEHGARGGDELNKIIEGRNYGWPRQTLGTRYNHLPWPNIVNYGRHDLYEAPFFSMVPSIGISNLIQIEDFHPSWDGDLLIGSLSGRSLWRLRVLPDRVLFAEPINVGERMRYIHQHSDGRIVIWTDDKEIVFVTVSEQGNAYQFIDKLIKVQIPDPALQKRVGNTLLACMTCHSFDGSDSAYGPSLSEVHDRKIGGGSFNNYTEALKNVDDKWSHENLRDYLTAPAEFAPGTSMPNPDLDEQVIESIINILRQLKGDWEREA